MRFNVALCMSFAFLFTLTRTWEYEDVLLDFTECEDINEPSGALLELAKDTILNAKNIQDQGETVDKCGKDGYSTNLNAAYHLIADAQEISRGVYNRNRSLTEIPEPPPLHRVPPVPPLPPPSPPPPPRALKYLNPVDCNEVYENGETTNGVYTIYPLSRLLENKPLHVFCDMETDGGGWTVIQRRGKFSKLANFYLDWQQYKLGFGSLTEEFWLGNDKIYALSNQGKYKLRVDLTGDDGEHAYAVYEDFYLDNEFNHFTVHVGGYSGNAGDGMELNDNMKFSTKDQTHDRSSDHNCPQMKNGAWWYKNCSLSNLNALLLPGEEAHRTMYWYPWKELVGLAASEMKIKRTKS